MNICIYSYKILNNKKYLTYLILDENIYKKIALFFLEMKLHFSTIMTSCIKNISDTKILYLYISK